MKTAFVVKQVNTVPGTRRLALTGLIEQRSKQRCGGQRHTNVSVFGI